MSAYQAYNITCVQLFKISKIGNYRVGGKW